jgi:hypothetical protein
MRLIFAGFAMLLVAITAGAETAYVTDSLRLGLHQAADTSGRAFRTLDSGQQLEILSQNRNYARVALPDGTQGYVKAAYLVTEKPAKLIVAETQARVEELEAELAETKQAFAVPGATITRLEQQLAENESLLSASQEEVADLHSVNENYRRRHEQFKTSLPITWVLVALVACLLGGFLAGLWWVDHRSRKRHGGIRVY